MQFWSGHWAPPEIGVQGISHWRGSASGPGSPVDSAELCVPSWWESAPLVTHKKINQIHAQSNKQVGQALPAASVTMPTNPAPIEYTHRPAPWQFMYSFWAGLDRRCETFATMSGRDSNQRNTDTCAAQAAHTPPQAPCSACADCGCMGMMNLFVVENLCESPLAATCVHQCAQK